MPPDSDGWRATTDHDRIRVWADRRGAVPARVDGTGGPTDLTLSTGDGPVPGERLSWDQFFELFEAEGLAFRFQDEPEGDVPARCDLAKRETIDDEPATTGSDGSETTGSGGPASTGTDEPDTERFATSDTGEGEPVVAERVEEREDRGDGEAASARAESTTDETRTRLALDELYEDPGLGESDDEYLAIANEGEERVDLGGWSVETDAAGRYEFPEGTTIEPGDRVVVHAGHGADTDGDLFWDADGPILDDQGGTVEVHSPDGRRVLREPYKG